MPVHSRDGSFVEVGRRNGKRVVVTVPSFSCQAGGAGGELRLTTAARRRRCEGSPDDGIELSFRPAESERLGGRQLLCTEAVRIAVQKDHYSRGPGALSRVSPFRGPIA